MNRRNEASPHGQPLSRSEIMARVRSKNTSPELFVRSSLHKSGLRYRIHYKDLPGKPDIVFPSRRVAIFVNGCFWHGHEGCKRARIPATRKDYWDQKLRRNRERDTNNYAALQSAGWEIIVFWECEISRSSVEELIERIKASTILKS